MILNFYISDLFLLQIPHHRFGLPWRKFHMIISKSEVIAAATDGSCSGNPGPGGWGALIRYENGQVEEFGGHVPDTTNNRMELTAAIEVLKRLKNLSRKKNLVIRTDSKYVIDGLSKWIKNWKKKGWITSSGKAVLNQDLWQELDKRKLEDVKLTYVKGHSGDPDNERVDKIAVNYSKNINISNDKFKNTSINSSSDECEIINSKQLETLISHLDIAKRIAENNYSINTLELSKLISQPMHTLQEVSSLTWRDWTAVKIDNNKWKLRKFSTDS